jgi:CHAT domain-containing protein/Tfp pilus assembly protein PilF
MLKNRAAAWCLISVVSLWNGLTAAEPLEMELKVTITPSTEATVEPGRAEEPAAPEVVEEPLVGRGVVVESVGKSSALEKAGLRPGDVLYRWHRLPEPPANPYEASGEFESPFDWLEVDAEQAPRGTVELEGKREGGTRTWSVKRGDWSAEVGPNWAEDILALYGKSQESIADEDEFENALRVWRWFAVKADHDDIGQARPWLALGAASAWMTRGNLPQAASLVECSTEALRSPVEKAYALEKIARLAVALGEEQAAKEYLQRALGFIREGMPSLLKARLLRTLGTVVHRLGDLKLAETYYRQALSIQEFLAPDSLVLSSTLTSLAAVAGRNGDMAAAQGHYLRSLAIQEMQAPESLEVAENFRGLGTISSERDDLLKAEQYFLQALRIQEAVAPQSAPLASTLGDLGMLAYERGDLLLASKYFYRALKIMEIKSPKGRAMGFILAYLGTTVFDQGDLEAAEAFFSQALGIEKTKTSKELPSAAIFNNLGNVAMARREFALAARYYREALEIKERLLPGSWEVGATLINLGILADRRGDSAAATEFYKRSLAIYEPLNPRGRVLAMLEVNLAELARKRGDWTEAKMRLGHAKAIQDSKTTGRVVDAITLADLGRVAKSWGDNLEASQFDRKALEIFEKLSPEASYESLAELGRLARKDGDLNEAAKYFSRSLEVLEADVVRLGPSRASETIFRATKEYPIFREAISLQIDLRDPKAGFNLLERSRAQSFLSMLGERDLVFSDLPPELDQERRRLAVRYDRTLQSLQDLSPAKDEEKIKKIQGEILMLRQRQQEIQVDIRGRFPRLAAIQYPQPLDIAAVRQALDPGTVLLAYSVGEKETFLFSVSPERGLAVKKLAVGEEELRQQVIEMRHLLDSSAGGSTLGTLRAPRLRELSRKLYALLVQPAEASLGAGQRVLLLADGPLHLLPFAALQRSNGEYLGAWKPLHTALSATVWAELKATRRPADGSAAAPTFTLAAFGDPHYPIFQSIEPQAPAQSIEAARNVPGDFRVRAAVETGRFDWSPLPGTRREVQEIARLFPEGSARIFLGQEATEDTVKALGREPRIIHFAVHGHLDDRFPWNSALALSIPENPPEGRDNGLLQVWEILESVRVDADLVVLSACDTGLGEEQGGEGLIGLTRAFQYAGARTVLASLWSVNDLATSELMIRFYKHLRTGLPKDQALQAAQQELIQGPIEIVDEKGERVSRDFSSPYYWAGFQLYGDWQ